MCFITFTFYEYSNMIFVLFFTRIPFYSYLKRKNFSKKKTHKSDKMKTRLDGERLIEFFLIRLFLILDNWLYYWLQPRTWKQEVRARISIRERNGRRVNVSRCK